MRGNRARAYLSAGDKPCNTVNARKAAWRLLRNPAVTGFMVELSHAAEPEPTLDIHERIAQNAELHALDIPAGLFDELSRSLRI